MARLTDDDFRALQTEQDRDGARALGGLRRSSGAQRNAEVEAWLAAGDNLAEKTIAALDTLDEARAARLVQRIVALPVVDEGTPSGLMAVNLVLLNEVVDPDFEGSEGLLDGPLRLLPQLDARVADELLHVLAAITDYDLPAALVRRISAVVPLERRFEAPFARVPTEALAETVTGVLRLVLRLRSQTG